MDAENDNELSLEEALEKLMETDIAEDARLKSGWQSIVKLLTQMFSRST